MALFISKWCVGNFVGNISSLLWDVTIFYFVCPDSKKCNAITRVWFRSVLFIPSLWLSLIIRTFKTFFPKCMNRKVLSFSRRLDSNLVDRFLSSSNIDEWCWKSVKETLEYILRRLKINVNAISCLGHQSSSFQCREPC